MWGVTHQAGSGVLSYKVTTKTSEVVRKGMLGKIPPILRGETLPKPSRTDEHIKVKPEVNDKLKVFERKNKKSAGLRGSPSGWKASSMMINRNT